MEDARELRIIGYADLFAAMKPLLVPGGADRLERMDSDRRRSGMLRTLAREPLFLPWPGLLGSAMKTLCTARWKAICCATRSPRCATLWTPAKEIFNGKIMN